MDQNSLQFAKMWRNIESTQGMFKKFTFLPK